LNRPLLAGFDRPLTREKCGPLSEGRKYCLKIPGLLGGQYSSDNLATAPLVELVRLAGDIGRQTCDFPDGTVVKAEGVVRAEPELDELFGSLKLKRPVASTREEKGGARKAMAREAAAEGAI
jgi:Domain of unknown function (DUF1851)